MMREVDVAAGKRNAAENNVKRRVWMTKIWISSVKQIRNGRGRQPSRFVIV